jgi:hypothetical protein
MRRAAVLVLAALIAAGCSHSKHDLRSPADVEHALRVEGLTPRATTFTMTLRSSSASTVPQPPPSFEEQVQASSEQETYAPLATYDVADGRAIVFVYRTVGVAALSDIANGPHVARVRNVRAVSVHGDLPAAVRRALERLR